MSNFRLWRKLDTSAPSYQLLQGPKCPTSDWVTLAPNPNRSSIKGGTSLRMSKKCNFRIFRPKSSITIAGSPLNFFLPYDKQNPLKMTTEILKNGKNNRYRFRFLALLKSNILPHYFRIFFSTNKNLVSFCSPNECASSCVAFFLKF